MRASTPTPGLLTTDGVPLATRRWEASGPPVATIVLVHGFTASKDEGRVVAVAEALQRAGMEVLCYDGRGHGQSGGLCSLGDEERLDVAAAVESVRRESPGSRIVAVGASMGAIAVLRHAAVDPLLAGVVTVSSPAAWQLPRTVRGLLAAGLTRTGFGRRVAATRLRVRVNPRWLAPEAPVEVTRRIRVPFAVVHGDRDQYVAVEASGMLRAAVSPGVPCRLTVVKGMGHAFDPAGIPAIVDSVDWVLAQRSADSEALPA
ncbi:MAG: alpha/beta hydrolase [Acidimicrobiales bacterium]